MQRRTGSRTARGRHPVRSLAVAVGLAALVVTAVPAAAVPAAPAATTTVTVGQGDTVDRPWLGFGQNWSPFAPLNRSTGKTEPRTMSDAAWSRVFRRTDYMRMPVIRLSVHREDYCPTGRVGTYDWNSPFMQQVYRILDHAKSRGTDVVLNMWNFDPWAYTSQEFADASADLVKHLVVTRGYTNVRFYNHLNEPNLDDKFGGSFTDYQTATRKLSAAFAARGLTSRGVRLVGPDATETEGRTWAVDSARTLKNELTAYGVHQYVQSQYGIYDGAEEAVYRDVVNRVAAADPAGEPFLMGEMGWKYGSGANPSASPWCDVSDCQPQVRGYAYGVNAADQAVQMARAGVSAPIAWYLDDAMSGKLWGMWDSVHQPGLRPWFYSYSLLSRYFPEDATLYAPAQPAGVRVLAGRTPSGSAAHWTFAVVNRDAARQVTLKVPGAGSGTFTVYTYQDGTRPTDADGFPAPSGTVTGDLDEGVTVDAPARGMVLVTTRDGQPVG